MKNMEKLVQVIGPRVMANPKKSLAALGAVATALPGALPAILVVGTVGAATAGVCKLVSTAKERK